MTANMDWSELPKPALINFALIASQSLRHGRHSLALVCSSWADAVAAADALVDELDVYR
jgi:hypothetical protein